MACAALAACTTAHADRAQSHAGGRASSVPATAPVPGDGNVHLTDYTANDSMTSTVVLTGAIGDHGSARRDDSGARLDLELSRGTFRLDLSDLDGRFLALMRHLAVNQRSCSASGRVPIVPGSGTGAYSALSGAFDLSTTVDEVYHPGACRETAPYLAQQIVTTGWGNISRT
jgi:hypothetical protein